MTKIFLKRLNEIQPSQLFISSGKLSQVMKNFYLSTPKSFEPIPVKELDGAVIFTDGHTRAFAAFLRGFTEIKVSWDEDNLDWEVYRICVKWCKTEGVFTIADLKDKVISPDKYEVLWYKRCEEMQKDLEEQRKKMSQK